MTAGADTPSMMPPSEQLAAEAVARLITDGYVSSVMKLKRPLLNEVARRLVDPGTTVDSVIDWLAEDGHAIPKTNVYRFAQRFREVYKQVRATWAERLIMAQITSDPDFDTDRLVDIARNRLHQLITQELITAQSPEDLTDKRIGAIIRSLRLADIRDRDEQSLAIARDLAEHRAAILQQQVEKLERQNESQRAAQVAAVEEAERAADEGASSDKVVSRMRELLGLPKKGGQAA